MVAINISDLQNGDLIKTGVNNRFSKIKGFLQSIPGTFLQAGSVNVDRLANQRAIFCVESRVEDLSGHADMDVLDGFKLPQLDGASYSAWKFRSYCVFARVVTHVAGNNLLVKKAGSTIATISMNIAAGGATRSSITEDTSATDDSWQVVYQKSGAPTYTDVTLRLYFSAQLIANS